MAWLRNWFRRVVMGMPDHPYRPLRDPLVLRVLRQEKRADKLWRAQDLFDVR